LRKIAFGEIWRVCSTRGFVGEERVGTGAFDVTLWLVGFVVACGVLRAVARQRLVGDCGDDPRAGPASLFQAKAQAQVSRG
jgi:hypothetical protein